MASFDLYPTIEMEGKAGRVVVNDCEMDKAHWRERGYKEIPGTKKGALMTVVEQKGTLENPGEIVNALGEPAIQINSTDEDIEGEPEETPSAPAKTDNKQQPQAKGKGK